jgi:hypothetical protein
MALGAEPERWDSYLQPREPDAEFLGAEKPVSATNPAFGVLRSSVECGVERLEPRLALILSFLLLSESPPWTQDQERSFSSQPYSTNAAGLS